MQESGVLCRQRGILPQPDGYRRYAATLLLGLFVLSFLDRQIVNILAEPIKRDLKLADWQIGIMSGLAFAVLYTIAGIPLARLAEHRSRPRIIGASVGAWSLSTAACGLVVSFLPLLAGRIAVGIGEAGLTPAAMSLIVDYSPPEKRASTLAHYHMGAPLGSLLGLALGGVLVDWLGWRDAFMVVGVPGLLLGGLATLTLREPRQLQSMRDGGSADGNGSFVHAVRTLTRIRSYRLFVLATGFQAFVSYGHAPFTASYFFRMHGEALGRLGAAFGLRPTGFLGLALGLSTGVAGGLGVWLGGQIADRVSRGNVSAHGTLPAVAALVTVPTYIIALLVPNAALALALLAIPNLFNSLWFGPVHTTQQGVAPAHMRATATALLLLVLNLIGLGLGPLAVGLLSDWFAGAWQLGPARGVQWALVVSSFVGLVPAYLFWSARLSIASDLPR